MKLGGLVLRLRDISTTFHGRVGGAAEYAYAREGTLTDEMCFIIPLQETASENQHDSMINQKIVEQFAVVVAIKNDTDYEDKTGFSAYNRLHTIRGELFKAFLGYESRRLFDTNEFTSESIIYYRGGQLLDFNRAYLWYQYTFEYKIGVQSQITDIQPDGMLDKIYADYELMESENIPYEGVVLPVTLFSPDMQQLVDLSEIETERASYVFNRAFSLDFDINNY